MPTDAQLQAEKWWAREVVTPEFAWLHREVATALGVPQANVGSKGDNLHLNGAHRSQEWILNSRYCTNKTYTVQQGLTAEQARHLAGCDITPATREQMLTICRHLDEVVRSGALEEIREWYGNTDNDTRVDGYNNVANRVASSDSSHLWHLHLTFDRRVLRDPDVMRRVLVALLYGRTAPKPDREDLMLVLVQHSSGGPVYLADGINLRQLGDDDLADVKHVWGTQLLNKGEVWKAGNLDAFGALPAPPGLVTVTAELMQALGDQVLRNVGPALQDAVSAGLDATLRRVKVAVDEALRDGDAPAGG